VEYLFAVATDVAADDGQVCTERDRAQVVDLHVPRQGDQVQWPVQLAHGFVEQSGDDAAVHIAWRSLVGCRELDRRCRGDCFGVGCVEDEVQV